jgi:hypothetical protein
MIKLAIALGEICLKLVKFLVQSAVIFIEAAVDAIVDAFMAFVQWAVNLILSVVDTVLSPIVKGIESLVCGYYRGIASAIGDGVTEYSRSGTLSLSTFSAFTRAWFGDFYWVLLGISAVITVVLLLLLPVTSVFSFLLSFVTTCVLTLIGYEAFGIAQSYLEEAEDEAQTHGNDLPPDEQPETIMFCASSLAFSSTDESDHIQVEILLKVVGALVIGIGTAAGILWAMDNAESKLIPLFKGLLAFGLSAYAFFEKGEARKCLTLISLPVSLACALQTWQAIKWDRGYGSIARVVSLTAFGITVWGIWEAFS